MLAILLGGSTDSWALIHGDDAEEAHIWISYYSI